MAESICRALRDGALEGEHAAALTIEDSLRVPLGAHAFHYFLHSLASHVSAGRSPARGLVLVAFERSPSFYFDLLKSRRLDANTSSNNCFSVIDCYSDPLGWKDRLQSSPVRSVGDCSPKELQTVFKHVRDVDKLLSLVIHIGGGIAGPGKARFAVAIDSVSTLLRYASLPSVASLISNLRSNGQVSSMFWLVHSDLHEPRVSAALEYLSTIVATLEPRVQPTHEERCSPEDLFCLEQNLIGGRFHMRLKRRNGRVKMLHEEFHLDQAGIRFSAVSVNTMVEQNLLPKVQFNLQLSEKERVDRANVVLPFEHQGNGDTIQIYDGRRSHFEEDRKDPHLERPVSATVDLNRETGCGKGGEIHYIRDSDDELPDSDEDPDDDLDI